MFRSAIMARDPPSNVASGTLLGKPFPFRIPFAPEAPSLDHQVGTPFESPALTHRPPRPESRDDDDDDSEGFSTIDVGQFQGRAAHAERMSILGCWNEYGQALRSLIWLSYRSGFQDANRTQRITDAGWGCMYRVIQMVLANTLRRRILGDDWRPGYNVEKTLRKYRQILALFADCHDSLDHRFAPFSMQALTSLAYSRSIPVNGWIGPHFASTLIRDLQPKQDCIRLKVYVGTEGTIIQSEVHALFEEDRQAMLALGVASRQSSSMDETISSTPVSPSPSGSLQAPIDVELPECGVLILLPLKPDLSCIRPDIFEHMKACLLMPQSMGIVGGRPNLAHFIVGMEGENFTFLDPHTTQVALKFPTELHSVPERYFSSYHTSAIQLLHYSKFDPNFAVAFYCATQRDFADLTDRLAERARHSPDFFLRVLAQAPPEENISIKVETSMDSSDDELLLLDINPT